MIKETWANKVMDWILYDKGNFPNLGEHLPEVKNIDSNVLLKKVEETEETEEEIDHDCRMDGHCKVCWEKYKKRNEE